MTHGKTPLAVLAAITLVGACTTETTPLTAPVSPEGLSTTRSLSGTGAYSYSLSGDIATPAASTPVATKKPGAPFSNLSVSSITVTLGAPSGNISACNQNNRAYDATFGANAGITAIGTLKIATTGTMSFLGTVINTTSTLQFSLADNTGGPVQSAGPTPGSYEYIFTDAGLFFGSNSVNYDAKYRCVNVTVTATP